MDNSTPNGQISAPPWPEVVQNVSRDPATPHGAAERHMVPKPWPTYASPPQLQLADMAASSSESSQPVLAAVADPYMLEDVRFNLYLRTMGGTWRIQTIGSLQSSPWIRSPGDGDATADIWMRHVVCKLRGMRIGTGRGGRGHGDEGGGEGGGGGGYARHLHGCQA